MAFVEYGSTTLLTGLSLIFKYEQQTVEKLVCRFELSGTLPSGFVYLLLDPDNHTSSAATFKTIRYKEGSGFNATYKGTYCDVTITKSGTSTSFTIPKCLVVIDGKLNATKVSTDADLHNLSGDLINKYSIATFEISGSYVGEITIGQPRITDNLNNSFTIEFDSGKDGTDNPIKERKWRWGYTINNITTYKTVTESPLTIKFDPENTENTIKVSAYNSATGQYGGTKEKGASLDVNQYVAPSAPASVSAVTITQSPSKTTLTPVYNASWGTMYAGNANSPIYRVAISAQKCYPRPDYAGGDQWGPVDGWGVQPTDEQGRETVASISTSSINSDSASPGDTIRFGAYAQTKDGCGNSIAGEVVYTDPVMVPGPATLVSATSTDTYQNKVHFESSFAQGYNNEISDIKIFYCFDERIEENYVQHPWEFDNTPTGETDDGRPIYEASCDIELESSEEESYQYAERRTVWLKLVTIDSFGVENITQGRLPTRQYCAPLWSDDDGKLSYIFTGKGPLFTYTWNTAEAANTTSPMCGYAIEIHTDNGKIANLGENQGYLQISEDFKDNEFVFIESTAESPVTSVQFYSKELGLKTGDSFTITIYPYTRFGEDNTGEPLLGISEEDTSKVPGGIVRIKVASGWKSGQVYVFKDSTWKPADAVYIKHNNKWKESV